MGVLAAFQWPVSFYQGGLVGLHKQVLFNVLRIGAATVSNGGAVLGLMVSVLHGSSFFSLAGCTNAILVFFGPPFMESLPSATRATQFDFGLLRNIGRFAAGMSGIASFSLFWAKQIK